MTSFRRFLFRGVVVLLQFSNGKKQDGGKDPIDSSIPITVDDRGNAFWEFTLIKALIDRAKNGETDLRQFEFFVTVEYYPHKRHNSPNVYVDNPDYSPPVHSTDNRSSDNNSAGTPSGLPDSSTSQQNSSNTNSAASQSPSPEPVGAKGTATQDQPAHSNPESGRTLNNVNPAPTPEGLIDAYFAKKTYTKETSESAGIHDYKINNDTKQKTKDVIAKEIFDIVTPKLKGERKYAKLDTIKNALTGSTPFKAGTIIKFETYKLGPEFKRIASAPLEDKVYLVASSYLLEGKNAKILIKEKDGLINGSADAVFPSLELTEAQMEQSEPLKESERTEKTEFSGTIKKVNTKNDKGEETESEMLIVPIQLRPKSDDDLKIWKEKLAKGKQDGTHTYKANNPFTIENEQEKNQIAGTITSRSNKELGSTHKIFKADVLKSLSADGKTVYDQVKDIPKYKKEPELLYLHVTAQGTTQHDEKFLNKEGVYFEIGGGCQRCIDVITLEQIETLFGVHSESTEFRKEVVKFLNLYIDQRRNTDKEIHINTCLRKAHFFAQVGAETSGINTGWMV